MKFPLMQGFKTMALFTIQSIILVQPVNSSVGLPIIIKLPIFISLVDNFFQFSKTIDQKLAIFCFLEIKTPDLSSFAFYLSTMLLLVIFILSTRHILAFTLQILQTLNIAMILLFYSLYDMLSYNLLMDLTTLKLYFQACLHAEMQLQDHQAKLSKIPSYSMFKLIAIKSQPKIDANLIRLFIFGFNWQAYFLEQDSILENSNYKIHSSATQMNSQQLLDYGIQLLINLWGSENTLTFEEFSIFIKGQNEIPIEKQVPYVFKKEMMKCFIHEILNLIKLERLKKAVFHEYRNISDLFESVTATRYIEQENINRLFLSFSEKKTQQQLKRINKRCKLPWDFDQFISIFKNGSELKGNEYKIYHSIKRVKDNEGFKDMSFTTPRKQKYMVNQSSTKLTRKYEASATFTTPLRTKEKRQAKSEQYQPQIYIQILADLLQIQQKFNTECSELIKRRDFDLQLVYQKHGKKFQQILNERYGVCNFSAFVRFIVPRDYQHRYLSLIRYQTDDILSPQTQELIDSLIQKYHEKQESIRLIWNKCDKEMFLRNFCLPKETGIRNQKLLEFFTTRETNILLQRLDPHKKGQIILQALN